MCGVVGQAFSLARLLLASLGRDALIEEVQHCMMVEDMIDRSGLRQWLEQPPPEGTPRVLWDRIKASFYEEFSEVVREARARVRAATGAQA
eukprot:10119665-Alexandrium_andersonii.AAC.1